MPIELAENRRILMEALPGWKFRLWDDDDFGWLQNQGLFNRANEIAPGSEGQLKSDLARYEILRLLGGVYMDLDITPGGRVEAFDALAEVDCFAGWETPQFANVAVLGAEAGHDLYVDLVDLVPESILANLGKRPNRMTGPHFFTPLALKHGCTIYPQSAFYPYACNELDRSGEKFPESVLVHHWANQRRLKGKPRE